MVILFNISYLNIAKAEEISWTVSQISGDAIIKKPGYQKKRLELYDNFAAGDLIATSANGTVGLSRNDEAMVISANSIIELPKNNNSNQITLVFQKLGTIIFSAKKRNRKHFEVRTPYSAAIVKGTTFVISVNQNNSQLQVFEGAVLLKGRGREESYIVKAGNKSLTPREVSKEILIQKVKHSSAINPHFGSDVSQLILNYAEKIEIGNTRENDFSSEPQNVKNKPKSTIGNKNKNKPKANKSKYIPETKPKRSNNGNGHKTNSHWNNDDDDDDDDDDSTPSSNSGSSNSNSSAKSNSGNGNSNSSAKSNSGNGNSNSSAKSNSGNGNSNSSANSNSGNSNGNSSANSNSGNSNGNSSANSNSGNSNGNSSANSNSGNGNGNSSSNSSNGNGNSNSNNGNGKGKK